MHGAEPRGRLGEQVPARNRLRASASSTSISSVRGDPPSRRAAPAPARRPRPRPRSRRRVEHGRRFEQRLDLEREVADLAARSRIASLEIGQRLVQALQPIARPRPAEQRARVRSPCPDRGCAARPATPDRRRARGAARARARRAWRTPRRRRALADRLGVSRDACGGPGVARLPTAPVARAPRVQRAPLVLVGGRVDAFLEQAPGGTSSRSPARDEDAGAPRARRGRCRRRSSWSRRRVRSTASTTAASSSRSTSPPSTAHRRASATSSTPSPASSRAASHGPSAIGGSASSAVVSRKCSPPGRVRIAPRSWISRASVTRCIGLPCAIARELAQRAQRRVLGGPEQRRRHRDRGVLVERRQHLRGDGARRGDPKPGRR